tara:strand:- start:239 stop:541 length:303 start_codon:yes stop_codon:yes gene_type:complete
MRKKFDVINISKGAWSTGDQIAALLNTGLKYNPDLFFLAFFPNDVPFLKDRKSPPEKINTWKLRIFFLNAAKYSYLVSFIIPKYDSLLENFSNKEPMETD